MSQTKPGRVKKVKYPLFMQCAELETTDFWKSVFQNCAYGLFPSNSGCKGNMFYYKQPKKKQSTGKPIPEDPKQALEMFKNIFRNEIGILSSDETAKTQVKIYRLMEDSKLPLDATWKSIRAPTVKHLMIAKFVVEMKEQAKLTDYETEQLLSCISMNLVSGKLSEEDMVIEPATGRLIEVHGLQRGEKGYFVDRPTPKCSFVIEKPIEHKQVSFFAKVR